MGPLALAALLLSVPASAQVKNERGCTAAQQKKIDDALPEARKRVADAAKRVKEKDKDAEQYGRLMLGAGYDNAEVGAILSFMAKELDGVTAHCSGAADKNCGSRNGYVRSGETGIMHLCPNFFDEKAIAVTASAAEKRIRTIVHESAHLAHPDIREPGGESYCVLFTCEDSCGDGPTDPGTNKSVPARVADNWAQFVHCASRRVPDAPETITVSRPKKK